MMTVKIYDSQSTIDVVAGTRVSIKEYEHPHRFSKQVGQQDSVDTISC